MCIRDSIRVDAICLTSTFAGDPGSKRPAVIRVKEQSGTGSYAVLRVCRLHDGRVGYLRKRISLDRLRDLVNHVEKKTCHDAAPDYDSRWINKIKIVRDANTKVFRDFIRDLLQMCIRDSYGNERQVGEAVRSSNLDRSEVFLETKIWISD